MYPLSFCWVFTLVFARLFLTKMVALYVSPTLLEILGASGTIYEYAYDYIFVILCGGLLPVLGNGVKSFDS